MDRPCNTHKPHDASVPHPPTCWVPDAGSMLRLTLGELHGKFGPGSIVGPIADPDLNLRGHLALRLPTIHSVRPTHFHSHQSLAHKQQPTQQAACSTQRAPHISGGNTGGRTMARTGALVGALLLFALISGWHHHLPRLSLTTRLPLLQNCREHWSAKARVVLRCTRVPPTPSRFPRICQPPASAVAIWVHPPPRFSSRIHGCKRARSPTQGFMGSTGPRSALADTNVTIVNFLGLANNQQVNDALERRS